MRQFVAILAALALLAVPSTQAVVALTSENYQMIDTTPGGPPEEDLCLEEDDSLTWSGSGSLAPGESFSFTPNGQVGVANGEDCGFSRNYSLSVVADGVNRNRVPTIRTEATWPTGQVVIIRRGQFVEEGLMVKTSYGQRQYESLHCLSYYWQTAGEHRLKWTITNTGPYAAGGIYISAQSRHGSTPTFCGWSQ